MASPREHVEEIRRKKFSIGGEENPLTEDLHQAVKNLAAELYAKDVHFLMELIQNAEDNEYAEGVDPSLEFVITSKDITATGAPATLIIFNNETGFSPKNIDSICSVGRSTKKGHRKKGYIGEKGIGFKSVFLITSTPYIFSNGYQIRFNEDPCEHCGLGYVVPEWVHQNPTLSQIQQIYTSSSSSSSTLLPTTTLVLPLKPDKVDAVTRQLSSVRPEIILFLSKIKRLSVSSGSAVSISKETEYVQRKNIDAESFTLHLSGGSAGQRSFYMWRQRFPVPPECRVERRLGVDEWAVTLAFPLGGGLDSDSDSSSPGVYAFLPTEMVTSFPFLIQADFLLSSSRETIMLDSPWNRGILERVPAAFVAAFKVMATGNPDAPLGTLPRLFGLLPVKASRYPELNAVREAIRDRMSEEHVVPSEAASTEQRLFHRPRDVGRLKPGFWTVLSRARREGLSLSGLSSHGSFVLASCFDSEEHDPLLGFLGVKPVESEWYGKCVRGSGLVEGLSEDGYLELVAFLAEHWSAEFSSTGLRNIPLIKYEDVSGKVSLSSVAELAQSRERSVFLSRCPKEASWLIDWNRELGCPGNRFFFPGVTQRAIQSSSNKAYLVQWLQSHANVGVVDVSGFASLLCCSLRERKLVVSFVHFLYHSMSKDFLAERRAGELCRQMPVLDNYGNVVTSWTGVLVPAKGSKWAGLVGWNAWRDQGYVELSGDYLSPGRFGGSVITNEGELAGFLRDRAGAEDVPSIPPPNARIAAANSPLTKANALLLLQWVWSVRSRGIRFPKQFSASLSEGNWLRVSLKGCSGFRPPSESFLLGSSKSGSGSWVSLLQRGSVLVDIPLVDQSYYDDEIKVYADELRTLGVKSEYSEACEFIGNRLMTLADSGNLTRENVLSILGFIKFLRSECLSPKEFVHKIRNGRWLRTCLGDKSPPESVWFDETWRVASQICNIPFVDRDHYGQEINGYKAELELLGVVVSSSARHQFLANCLKSPSHLARLSSDGFLLLLECMRFLSSSDQIRRALTGTQCLKTNSGYRSPGGSVLCDPNWGCLLKIFDGVPLIDLSFYDGDTIFSFKNELKQLGVVVDFEQAVKEFTRCFRVHASSRSVSKENVMSLLSAYRQLKSTFVFPSDLTDCIRDLKWLRTQRCDYYRSPKECILYSSDWEAVSPIAHLPFIDDTDSWYGKSVHEYKKELKSMGVVVDFKSGVKFVASGLYFNDIESMTRETALALLECVRILSEEKGYKFPEKFTENLLQPWLKTCVGYRPPNQSLLYDSKFAAAGLKKKDGPFIDEEFYGPKLASYRETLAAIGVVVEVEKGCPLIAGQVELQATLSKITRLYDYLGRYDWEPKSEWEKKIWIPNGSQKGKWVRPEDCVVSDKSGLFSSQLTILDKHNLFFLSHCFKVKPSPCTEDYCRLWKTWESSEGLVLTHDECCKFWGFIVKNWTSKSEKTLPKEFAKVPVKVKDSGSNGVVLMDKTDVFIADDLQLKDLFEKRCSRPIFVWYPQPSPPSLSRAKLLGAFRKIGVRTISESVQREQEPSIAPIGIAIPSTALIGLALAKLVLGFLASPGVEMEPEERHKALGDLLKLSVVETEEPISVRYGLALSSSGERPTVNVDRTVRWERESSKIFTQKMDGSRGPGCLIERATYFSEAIAEGLLWESGDHIHELAELLKLAFVLGFDDKAVDFLMKSKNLQIFVEDENFLSASFPSD